MSNFEPHVKKCRSENTVSQTTNADSSIIVPEENADDELNSEKSKEILIPAEITHCPEFSADNLSKTKIDPKDEKIHLRKCDSGEISIQLIIMV